MRRICLLITLLISGMFAVSVSADVVYLNNGQVVKGKITELEKNSSVTIQTYTGNTYTYPMIEVNRLSYDDSKIKVPHHSAKGNGYSDYTELNRGFFFAADALEGFSLNRGTTVSLAEVNVIGGYRFNEYIRLGAGFGPRYYTSGASVRYSNSRWALPLFFNGRGNFIPSTYRDVVPFWSFDIGTTFPDGFMFRPSLGIRIGQNRSAFTVNVCYLGQTLRQLHTTENNQYKIRHNYYSFLGLRLGYEF